MPYYRKNIRAPDFTYASAYTQAHAHTWKMLPELSMAPEAELPVSLINSWACPSAEINRNTSTENQL